MVHVEVIRHFSENDINRIGENTITISLNGKVVKDGDQYHDHIEQYYEGFMDAILALRANGVLNYDLKHRVKNDLENE